MQYEDKVSNLSSEPTVASDINMPQPRKDGISDLNSALIVTPDEDGTVTIACPQCRKRKNVDVSAFKESHVEAHKALKTKCACGHAFRVAVDTRRYSRKKTALTGAYIKFQGQKSDTHGFFTVEDISMTGLKLRTKTPHYVQVGEVLKINLVLDDEGGSEIWASLQVKHVQDFSIGGAFCDLKDADNRKRLARHIASL
ncbi:MAG: PilZ domain-containing protein [bacterium]|nr:PilZ domain-containing protein [bacterium]